MSTKPTDLNPIIEELNEKKIPSMGLLAPLSSGASYHVWWYMVGVVRQRILDIAANLCCVATDLVPMDFSSSCYSANGLTNDVLGPLKKNTSILPSASVYGSGLGQISGYAQVIGTGDFYDGGGGFTSPFFPLTFGMNNLTCPTNNGGYVFWYNSYAGESDGFRLNLSISKNQEDCKIYLYCNTLRHNSCYYGYSDTKSRILSILWPYGLNNSYGPTPGTLEHGNTSGSNTNCQQQTFPVDPDVCTLRVEIKLSV
jgi:hypothetical protein